MKLLIMSIPFTKMHGLGNDFVVLNALKGSFNLTAKHIKLMADRRYGIGFDQMLVIEPHKNDEADFFFRIYNADGTEAEQCGNGLRCVAKFAQDHGLVDGNNIRIACKGGLMEAELEDSSMVKVNMGPPAFAPKDIPCNMPNEQLIYNITVLQAEIHLGIISMGNPHAVICVDDINTVDVAAVGEAISAHDAFPKGVNVGFLQVTQPYSAILEVFERGSGKTPACGSGACAAMVYGNKLGILEREVSIIQPGGELVIEWAGGSNPVYMTGPAINVYEGQWL
jgi:diaminopimelate epimerase